MKTYSTKHALWLSVLSMVLCFAMLIGTTFAWFTDTASSGVNKIKAGNLDVDLIMDKEENGNYVSIAGEDAAIFGGENSLIAQNKSNDTLWEPGKTQIVYLGVQNKGSLALKYSIELTVTDTGLASALEYAIIDGAKKADLASATDWNALVAATSLTGNLGSYSYETQTDTASGTDTRKAVITAAQGGVLDECINGTENETDYFALAVHMKEDAGNEYMGKGITIDVTINATQYTAESDSFDNQYDIKADDTEDNHLSHYHLYVTEYYVSGTDYFDWFEYDDNTGKLVYDSVGRANLDEIGINSTGWYHSVDNYYYKCDESIEHSIIFDHDKLTHYVASVDHDVYILEKVNDVFWNKKGNVVDHDENLAVYDFVVLNDNEKIGAPSLCTGKYSNVYVKILGKYILCTDIHYSSVA